MALRGFDRFMVDVELEGGGGSAMVEDPRWIEHDDASAEVNKGLRAHPAAHERYRQSLLPYCELLAECEPHVRKPMMRALVDIEGVPFGIVAVAFKATVEERAFVEENPPTVPEPVDEIERLQQVPYSAYLKTSHWQQVRQAALERAENRCQLCNNHTGPLDVHHRSYDRKGCERPADVIVLCRSCHKRHHAPPRAA